MKHQKKVTESSWRTSCPAAGRNYFFFTYYQVDEVQVMGSSHYSEKQIRKMVLRGPLASNSVFAPLLYTKQNTKDVPFVEGYTVTRLNRHTICVSVKEKDIVGCYPLSGQLHLF